MCKELIFLRYSYDPGMKSCMLLSECNTLDTSNYGMGCSKCISGEKQCDESDSVEKCWIPGKGHFFSDDVLLSTSMTDCYHTIGIFSSKMSISKRTKMKDASLQMPSTFTQSLSNKVMELWSSRGQWKS